MEAQEMAEKDDMWHRGMRLVLELDSILEFDPYIDELGFVHPSQLESLHSLEPFALDHERPFFMKTRRKPDGQGETSEDSIEYAEDVSQRSEGHEVEAEQQPRTNPDQSYYLDSVQSGAIDFSYDKSAFWCCHHKLAIAERALAPIFEVAKKEFFANRKAYTTWMAGTRSSSSTHATSRSNQLSDISLGNGHANGDSKIVNMDAKMEETALQKNIMLYTRVLVIVNSDFASAWNARKRILSRTEATEASLLAELRLAGMVLAYGPKSEESWAHRRWIINRMFAGEMRWKALGSVLEGDSLLVEIIAGRSTMNYRAWRHRYWLVSRMTLKQALSELQDSKRWAQSHVADNCCFHYRRCLLLGLLQAGSTPDGKTVSGPTQADSTAQANSSSAFSIINPQNLTTLWKEEFSWNKDLIERYVGREALWLHRRFLIWGFSHYSEFFESIPISVKPSSCDNTSLFEGKECSQRAAQLAKRELQFADACIAACRVDSLDDAGRQREYAAAYKLWVFWLYNEGKDDGKHEVLELNSLELLLKETSPHRECLWNGLVPNLGLSS